jgi:hypothetical protein
MKAADFRPLIESQLQFIESTAPSHCTPESVTRMQSLVARCRVAVLEVCADGTVTQAEGTRVFDIRNAASDACVLKHAPPSDDDDDDDDR